MLSGVIFLVLALLWAVFLIPKALKHHDEVARTRSVDEISDSARVLARREAVTARDARLVVGPVVTTKVLSPAAAAAPQSAMQPMTQPMTEPSLESAIAAVPLTHLRRRAQARRAAAASAARRRRRILLGLLLSTAAVRGVAAYGALPAWSPAIPALLVVAFLVVARLTVRRANAVWDAEKSRLVEGGDVERPAQEVPVPAPAHDVDELGTPVVSATEETAAFDAAQFRAAVASPQDGSLWDPLPVTLPTYVTKPRATRSVRTIDLRDPGVSSSGRDEADTALVAEAAAADAAVGQAPEESSPAARVVNS